MDTDTIEILQKYKKQILNSTLKDLYQNHYVISKSTNEKISLQELKEILEDTSEEKMCIGIIGGNKQCTRKACLNFNYCKSHIQKYKAKVYKEMYSQKEEKEYNIEFNIIKETHPNIETNLIEEIKNSKKVFIDDSFYHLYNNDLYDPQSFQKCGIVQDSEYILTEDPFIINW
jgi:hypothetical protein